MIFTKLKLHNFLSHHDFETDLYPGITGITGVNGSGKSALFTALSFLCTGDLGPVLTKRTAIRDQGPEGFAYAEFKLNDKEGSILRHLDNQKVILKYDDKVYKKVGEIDDLWNKLLLIDKTVFLSVIMARQNQIDMLFKGDKNDRLSVFKKFFLVPDATTVQKTIWRDYLNKCPNEYPVQALGAKEALLKAKQELLVSKEAAIQQIEIALLPEDKTREINDQLYHLKQCLSDAENLPGIKQDIADTEVKLQKAQAEYNRFKEGMKTYPMEAIGVAINVAEQDMHRLRKKSALETSLLELQKQIAQFEESNPALADKNKDIQNMVSKFTTDEAVLNIELEAEQKRAVELAKTDDAECPICKQAIHDKSKLIKECRDKVKGIQEQLVELRANKRESLAEQAELRLKALELEGLRSKVYEKSIVLQNIATDQDATPEAAEAHYRKCLVVKQAYAERERGCTEQLELVQTYTAFLEQQKAKLAYAATYRGTTSAVDEYQTLSSQLDKNQHYRDTYQIYKSDIEYIRREVADIQKEIKETQDNQAYNTKRNKYYNTLQYVADRFKDDQFPKLMMQHWSTLVNKHLNANLKEFRFPYTANITDEFAIVLTKPDGSMIPIPSGGQSVIIGLCLRLALHSLFSQAFPVFMIDEATANMDNTHKQMYFSLIQELRKTKRFQQLLIIDHEPALLDVVDHTITIENK